MPVVLIRCFFCRSIPCNPDLIEVEIMKGIILAGGTGSRLWPLTIAANKQLLPVYDKPMIYYPLSILMLAGIRDILVISTPREQSLYRSLLDDGSQWGLSIKYAVQHSPNGIAEAFLIGEEFIGGDSVCLILGDNIYHGHKFPDLLQKCASLQSGAVVFGYVVNNPERYGVIEFNDRQEPVSIVEKPDNPVSKYAVTGLYFYDNSVVSYAKSIIPSARNELEITDINNIYLKNGNLRVELLGRGVAWFDMGTPELLLDASSYIRTLEKRLNCQICSPDEIAYEMHYIDNGQLRKLAEKYKCSDYGRYLAELAETSVFRE